MSAVYATCVYVAARGSDRLTTDGTHRSQTLTNRRNGVVVVVVVAGFPYNKLMSRTLYLQVLDYDRFTRDDPIGEVCLPLCDISLAREQTFWRTLQPCKGHTV